MSKAKALIKRDRAVLYMALIVMAGILAYVNSIGGEFVLDDEFLIKNNVYIKDFSFIKDIFSKDIGTPAGVRYYAYRPLQILSYALDYSLWKLDARGYHLSSVLLHILVALCIFWFINILYNNKVLSFLTAVLFSAHPIHAEAVAYISGRADPLAALFMLLSFIFYLECVGSYRKIFPIFALLSYICALLSRENSIVFPLLLLLYHYNFGKRIKFAAFLPILTVAALYILLRLTILPGLIPDISRAGNVWERIPGFFAAITDYIRLLIVPLGLHMEYGNKLFTITDFRAVLGIIMTVFLLTLAFKKRHTLVSFSIFWFFIALIPHSNICPVNAYMAEHWLYLPSLGFFLMLSSGLNRMYNIRSIKAAAVITTVGLFLFYSYLTVAQNECWRKPLLFYERTLRYVKDSPKLYNNLGILYSKEGQKKAAAALFEKAIEIEPNYAKSYGNLGNVYRDIGESKKALEFYKKAAGLEPDNATAAVNLGSAYIDIGENEKAVALCRKAIELMPYNQEAYYNLGLAYYNSGKTEEAIVSYNKALELEPDNAKVYNNLGLCYYACGRNDQAIALYKKALELNPRFGEAYNSLGVLYSAIGRYQEAVDSYKKVIEIDPRQVKAYNNLGNEYLKIGRSEEAVSLYKKAIGLDPAYSAAYFNLSVAYLYQKQYELAVRYCDEAIARGHKANPELIKMLEPYRRRDDSK